MEYLQAFLVGGILCLIGQILVDKTSLTPARILVELRGGWRCAGRFGHL